jgi:transcriptional regulator with XRE-family HTH domain
VTNKGIEMAKESFQANGEVIKALRISKGWTQEELGIKAGWSKRTIENAEASQRLGGETLRHIAEALSVKPEECYVPNSKSQQKTKEEKKLLHNLLNDAWLRKSALSLIAILKETEDNKIIQREAKDMIDIYLEDFRRNLRSPFPRAEFHESDELARMRRLKTIIEDARDYVYAVTLDMGNYINSFWAGKFSGEYITANIQESASVMRIFILGRDVIKGKDKEKRAILDNVLDEHMKADLDVRVICIDRLPPSWRGHDTSFLICDGCVASESHSLSATNNRAGYVLINDHSAVRTLKKLFEDLWGCPDENWKLPLSNN